MTERKKHAVFKTEYYIMHRSEQPVSLCIPVSVLFFRSFSFSLFSLIFFTTNRSLLDIGFVVDFLTFWFGIRYHLNCCSGIKKIVFIMHDISSRLFLEFLYDQHTIKSDFFFSKKQKTAWLTINIYMHLREYNKNINKPVKCTPSQFHYIVQ